MYMKKKVVKKTKATGGHLKHMGHGTDDMTMIIMVVVVILTGQMVTSGHRTAVAQVSASGSSR
jgi:hypothetical protein